MKRRSKGGWASYERCFVLTLGVGFVAVAGYVAGFESADFREWPAWALPLLGSLAALGVIVLLVGMSGSARTVQRLARGGSTHEASFFIMLVAAPLYCLFNFWKR